MQTQETHRQSRWERSKRIGAEYYVVLCRILQVNF
jgi:hypothetical protein